jgi:hypothetical protein
LTFALEKIGLPQGVLGIVDALLPLSAPYSHGAPLLQEATMLTIQDCIDMSDLDIDEVLAIAHHEHLPDIVAIELAHSLLKESWGEAAIRQMIIDEVHACIESGNCTDTAKAVALLAKTFAAHPGGIERRKTPHHALQH